MSGETIESLLYRENRAVLELRISYPQIMGPLSQKSEYRFNDYYCRSARAMNRQARTERYHRAAEEARMAAEQGYDFTLHSLIRSFSVTRLEPRYTSLLFDRYDYAGGAHGTTVRTANTWDFAQETTVPLSWFFLPKSPYRREILRQICAQIAQQKEKEEIQFFERAELNARQCFSEQNFYLTANALAFFYPLYTLAPFYAGILCYKIPFGLLDPYWIKERRPAEVAPFTGNFAQRFGTELL